MNYDHEAIRKAYPNVVIIDDSTGIFDANGDVVTIDQSNVSQSRSQGVAAAPNFPSFIS